VSPYPYYPPVVVPYGPIYPGVYPIVTTPWPIVNPGDVYISDPPPGMTTVTWCSTQTVHAN
jgi:hypothetical protein